MAATTPSSSCKSTLEPSIQLDLLEARLGHSFHRPELLRLALRHESFANEEGQPQLSNERLEFLGDAVLGLVVCDFLYHRFPEESEGRLAQMKAQLVSTETLAGRARNIELGEWISLGRGEQQGRDRNNLLADAFEAVIGAIYLDGGFPAAEAFVLREFSEVLHTAQQLRLDYKSELQELLQRDFRIAPDYCVVHEEGPSHEKYFEVEVRLFGRGLGRGGGRSKREASQKAAEVALASLAEGPLLEELSRLAPQAQDAGQSGRTAAFCKSFKSGSCNREPD